MSKPQRILKKDLNQEQSSQPETYKIGTDLYVKVFISMSYSNETAKLFKTRDMKELSELFTSNLNLYVRKSLVQQIGVSYEEAVAIENQHSHFGRQLIVEALIPSTQISPNRISEKDMWPSALSASKVKYYTIKNDVVFVSEYILSLRALRENEHRNSIKGGFRFDDINIDGESIETFSKHQLRKGILELQSPSSIMYKHKLVTMAKKSLEKITHRRFSQGKIKALKNAIVSNDVNQIKRALEMHRKFPFFRAPKKLNLLPYSNNGISAPGYK
jgi:hypothetical protein